MRASNGGDLRRVAGCGQPVVDGSADPPALHRRVARPMMAGDQQDDTVAGADRLLERAVDRGPCAVEVQAVQVDDAVGLDRTCAQAFVPAAVERLVRDGDGSRAGFRPSGRRRRCSPLSSGRRLFNGLRRDLLPRERRYRRRDTGPELRFVRAERAHGRPHPSAEGARPGQTRTCRRRCASPPRPRPNMCRRGSAP